MQAVVSKAQPTAWSSCSRNTRWIGGHTGNFETRQQGIGAIGEPVGMAGLAGHLTHKLCPERAKERGGSTLVKIKAGWQLDEQGAEPVA